MTLDSCNQVWIDTIDKTLVTVTINAITYEQKTVSTAFDVQIVNCNSETSIVSIDKATIYNQVVVYDA